MGKGGLGASSLLCGRRRQRRGKAVRLFFQSSPLAAPPAPAPAPEPLLPCWGPPKAHSRAQLIPRIKPWYPVCRMKRVSGRPSNR